MGYYIGVGGVVTFKNAKKLKETVEAIPLERILLETDCPYMTPALETMAGKGSEIGREFEELKRIYDGVKYPENLRVCFDTCHVSDSGLDPRRPAR